MKRILVVGGTVDSVEFVKKADPDFFLVVTVFSEQGENILPQREKMKVCRGALDRAGFIALLAEEKIDDVVDLSHPFAVEVSANIKAAAKKLDLPYYRFERDSFTETGNCIEYADFEAAAKGLTAFPGNILLTIGSRHLDPFLSDPRLKDRCYMRVLASSKVLKELEEKNVDPGHVFAMKGVASVALNIALAKEIGAVVIVSKDSGLAGGLAQKAEACEKLGIPLIIVGRPSSEGTSFHDMASILNKIRSK